ncbi:MAG: RluA family pseudouridine synthase [Rhodospirillaceae bacterium]|nr:RluA family pseudouridine synthase [Rhodospirillaceae bacterium]
MSGPGGRHLRVHAGADDTGARLDKALARHLPDLSRSRLQGLLAQGRVACDGQPVRDASVRVKAGQTFDIFVPEPVPARPAAEQIALSIVFEDDALLVVDKPAGLVVHPAAGNPCGTLVNALLAHCGGSLSGIGGVVRPGIVHRLDKDTSGLMVVAKTDIAHQALSRQFAGRALSREYAAVVIGVPQPTAGEIAGAIGRSPVNRKKMAVVARGGKDALTRYRVERSFGTVASLLRCRLATGRTHQIRVHLAHVGHPLIGDPLYGRKGRGGPVPFGRQALHAARIEFFHPLDRREMRFESEFPQDMNDLLRKLEDI